MRRKDRESRFCNISKRDPGTKKIHTEYYGVAARKNP